MWGCFAASGSGRLGVTEEPTNSKLYQEQNVRASVCDLKLKRSWVMQHDNDPKHRSQSTTEQNKRNSALHNGQIRGLTPLPLKSSAVM